MKIAHISDLHISRQHKFKNIHLLKKILNYIIEQKVDHLIITGDLIDNSEKGDFRLLRNILKEFGFLNSKKLSLVIGNHDIFGGIETAEDIVNFPKKCLSINYKQKMRDFYSYFKECFDNCYFSSKSEHYPYAKDLGDVVLIGINSISKYSRIRNSFASNGKVTKAQQNLLKEIFEKKEFASKKKIVMIHHHFCKYYERYEHKNTIWANVEKFTLKLRGKKKLIELFLKHKVDLILHGHLHESLEYSKDGLRFLNAGGSIDNNGESYLKINFIDIANDEIKTQIVTIPKYKYDKNIENIGNYSKKKSNSVAI
jgi:3',5'-cyclic AMP phosphodiesterase CpdA